MSPTLILATILAGTVPLNERIDLADFARVVKYTGNTPQTLEVREIGRGPDGWEVWKGEDGQYMIGVEWDEPRDIAEVNIEFRHAIAGRGQIKVQYFRRYWPKLGVGGWGKQDDPFHGQWVTAKNEWWAGDRDVSLAFVPYDQEQPGEDAPTMGYRRTYRLRFLLGKRELPPVRFIRAYGPSSSAEAAFDIRFDEGSKLKPPLDASVVNGYLLEDGATTQYAQLDAEATSFRIQFADGDLETPTKTIVTLRNKNDPLQGFSFLPAEVVKYGIIRIPALGAVVAHRGSRKDLQAGLSPGMSVFDRVEREPEQTFERARREIPELKKSRQTWLNLYLPLAPPYTRQEIGIMYNCQILCDTTSLMVPAADSKRLKWPEKRSPGWQDWYVCLSTGEPGFDHNAEGNVKQRLLDGYLPIVINSWEQNGIEYEQTCVASFLDPEPRELSELRGDETVVMGSRLKVTNSTDRPQRMVVRLWDVWPEALVLEGEQVWARGAIDPKTHLIEPYDKQLYRFRFKHSAQAKASVETDVDGNPERMILCQRELAPGQSDIVEWFVPFITLEKGAELQRILQLDFDKMLRHEATRWRKIVGQAAVLEVPDKLLNDFYKAQLTHILISADRDPYDGSFILPAATIGYNVCQNESCYQIRSLEMRGLHDEAERFLETFIQKQGSRKLDGRFTDKKGCFNGMPSKQGDYQGGNYNLDHGFVMWTLNEHYRFTRDRKWLARVADALIAGCDHVTRQRNVPPESNTLGRDDTFWGVGLLPPGHLEDPPEWLWWFTVNAYAYRGMQATAESLTEINHPEAARIAQDAKDFGDHLRRSCKEAMIRSPVVRLRDGTYVPHQPTRSRLRGRDLGWIRDGLEGPIHLIDCGVYPDDSPEAEWILRDMEDNIFIGEARGRKLEDFERQWFSWGGITLQSNLLPNPLVYLRRNQPKHVIRAFYNSLAANVYADVRTFTEHPIKAYGIGQGPFFKPPDESGFLIWLRHMLIMERGKDLELLAGVPVGWLAPGKQIKLERAATWFGPMDMLVESKPKQIKVTLSAPHRNPPGTIRLHLRRVEPIQAVTVNGRAVSTFDVDKRLITLPGSMGQAEILISYEARLESP